MGFMFVTGLVLFLGNYKKDHLDIVPFWIKRFKGSGISYVFWNGFYILITLLVMGSFTFPEWLGEWGDTLLHGNRFYLYYILVTMQLYLIFPIMLWLYKRFVNRHNLIISISALIQLLFLFYIKYIFPHQDHTNWPYLFRYALGVMWTTLIVAETVSADSGIGYMSTNDQQFMNMKTIFLCILIYALLGKLSDFIAKNLEDILLYWRN